MMHNTEAEMDAAEQATKLAREEMTRRREAYEAARDASGADYRRIQSEQQALEAAVKYGHLAEYEAFIRAGAAYEAARGWEDRPYAEAVAALEASR
jgi:hypothetical protein